MQTPEPNSAARLEALYKTDPMLAAHVRALLADVGCSDVCAICGDDHPADYLPGIDRRSNVRPSRTRSPCLR